ncbi:hypothetical protein B0H14DRAFT_2343023, partial [Mycena olivaceomarginata]
ARVAARYLPGLVNLFKQTPGLLNCVTTLMNVISTTPYFVRFLRSPPGDGLAAFQVKRVAGAVDEISTMSADDVAEVGQFLSSVLLLQGIQDVAEDDKAILLLHLPIWGGKYPDRLASETAHRCIALLGGPNPFVLKNCQNVNINAHRFCIAVKCA